MLQYTNSGGNNITTNITRNIANMQRPIFFGQYTEVTNVVNGSLSPIVILVTLITNSLVCAILVRKKMRTPTNLILVAMAISDTLTGLMALPFFIYVYTMKNNRDYIKYEACWMNKYLADVLPTIFHTVSIWLTVALGLQRYLHVCKPVFAKKWCTSRNSVIVIVAVYVAGTVAHVCRLFDTHMVPVTIPSLYRNGTIVGCVLKRATWLESIRTAYYGTYYWLRVILIHMIPCTVLVVLNFSLVRQMRSAIAKHKRLFKDRQNSCRPGGKSALESSRTTWMLIVVVSVFLVVEFPVGVYLILFIIQNTFNVAFFSPRSQEYIFTIVNFCVLLSYPLNFFIYCVMSRQFRESFLGLFSRLIFKRQANGSTNDYSRYTLVETTKV